MYLIGISSEVQRQRSTMKHRPLGASLLHPLVGIDHYSEETLMIDCHQLNLLIVSIASTHSIASTVAS